METKVIKSLYTAGSGSRMSLLEIFFSALHTVNEYREEKAMLVGYARVSTEDRQLTLQVQVLKTYGCKRIFSDKAGGARTDRSGLKEAMR